MNVSRFIVLPVIGCLAPAFAAAPQKPAAAAAPHMVDGNYLLELAFALGLVVVCILLFAWLLKRLQGVSGRRAGVMRVVGALSLSTRERVVLLQVGERQLLIGVAPGRVSRLCEFDEPVVDAGKAPAAPANFAALLETFTRRGRS